MGLITLAEGPGGQMERCLGCRTPRLLSVTPHPVKSVPKSVASRASAIVPP
eukprot:COSAG01_NODE_49464_length_370_cov_0.567766_1_plen_50_part_10